MKRRLTTRVLLVASVLIACLATWPSRSLAADADGKLRILLLRRSPRRCRVQGWRHGGQVGRLGASREVRFGHQRRHRALAVGRRPVARRRSDEVHAAAKILGIETEVLDIHDGELLPTLENRRTITRLIRNWKADVVVSHRPNDYHPDHRYTGVLVQDAAFMVTVPYFCPDTPSLLNNPVFLYYSDGFQRPNPFTPDVAVAIDDVFDKKIDAIHALPSQVYEGARAVPRSSWPTCRRTRPAAAAWAIEHHGRRYAAVADRYRDALVKWYGDERRQAREIRRSLRDCEYGRRPSPEDLKRLFPFFGP